jgi:chemotaxis protein histidine kinase CheA
MKGPPDRLREHSKPWAAPAPPSPDPATQESQPSVANDRFLSMFFEEAGELLQAFEAGLMDLEARQGDRAHLDRTFRAAHTLKGAAGMVGLGAIAEFTYGVETVLDRIRSGERDIRPEINTTLLKAHPPDPFRSR